VTESTDRTTPNTPAGARRGRLARRFGRWAGALCAVAGLTLLATVAWQLWGTGIITARDQHRLGHQFQAQVSRSTSQPATKPAASAPAASDVVEASATNQSTTPLGGVLAHLVIPKIGVNDYVVQGVGESQLAEGPGHYPGTAAIGGNGNVGIAGHRTTYGAPFFSLNELSPGDLIYLTNTSGQEFTYRVTTQFVVPPSDGAVLDPTPVPSLTLTTCTPRYSATDRLVVRAVLVP
jgi:sortase A